MGTSILHVVERPADDRERQLLDESRSRLLAVRSRRVRPGLDDKVLSSSNGLAIAGLAEAGRVLSEPAFVDGARRTADFVLTHMTEASQGRLLRTFKHGQGGRLPGTLDDHALVTDGLIALYEASGESRWLEHAFRLTRLAIDLFYDADACAFYMTAVHDPGLIQRPVSSFDHAVPSGMSVCLENLIRLGDVCNQPAWLAIAERVLRAHYARALENPFGFSNLLNALDLWLARPTEIVLAGDTDGALARALAGVYLPNRVIARADGAPPLLKSLTDGKTALDGKAAAYVCRDFSCQRPETDPAALAATLAR